MRNSKFFMEKTFPRGSGRGWGTLTLLLFTLTLLLWALPFMEPGLAAPEQSLTEQAPQKDKAKSPAVAGDLKEAYFTNGVRFMKSGDYEKACTNFLKAVNVDFNFSDLARYYHARCCLAISRRESRSRGSKAGKENLARAAQSMRRLIQCYPASPLKYKALVDLGRMELDLGNTDAAIDSFNKAIEEAAVRPEIRYIYTADGPEALFQLLIDALESQKKWADAADAYFRRLTLIWLRENGHVLRRHLAELGKKYKLPYVERKYYREMAALYSRTGNHAKVVEILGKAKAAGENLPDNLSRMYALSLASLGRREEALEFWRLMKVRAGSNGSLVRECDYNIANLLKALGRDDQAREIWLSIAGKYPRNYLADNCLLAAAQATDGEPDLKLLEQVVWDYPEGDAAARAMHLALELLEKRAGIAGTIPFLKKSVSAARDTELYPFLAFRLSEAYTRSGKSSKAHSVMDNLIKDSPDDYYSLFSRIGPDKINAMGFEAKKLSVRDFDRAVRLSFVGLPGKEEGPVKVADHTLALRLKEYDLALLLLHDRIRKAPSDLAARYNLCLAYYLTSRYNASIRHAEMFWKSEALRKKYPDLEYFLYPFCHAAAVLRETGDGTAVDPLFVQAIMREESRFRHDDVSWSGAVGLMQIMPKTGQWIAGKIGDGDFREEKLFDPSVNIRYGSWYIDYLAKSQGKDLFDVAAAYNGGPGSLAKWRKKFGTLSKEEFVEAIPFDETRRYVKKVIRSYAIYRRLYVPVTSRK